MTKFLSSFLSFCKKNFFEISHKLFSIYKNNHNNKSTTQIKFRYRDCSLNDIVIMIEDVWRELKNSDRGFKMGLSHLTRCCDTHVRSI